MTLFLPPRYEYLIPMLRMFISKRPYSVLKTVHRLYQLNNEAQLASHDTAEQCLKHAYSADPFDNIFVLLTKQYGKRWKPQQQSSLWLWFT